MNLLDRYLKSVASFLPADQKEDILRELDENLRSQVEEKEADLGRPLTESELEAILKEHGHPLVVASRYRQDQRSVSFGRRFIGPVLFPPYAKVLSFNLGLTSAVIIIIFSAMFAAGQHVTVSNAMFALLYQSLIQFGVITLIFSAMQTHFDKYPDRWSAKNPSGFEFSSKIYRSAPKGAKDVSRLESICVLVASAVGLVWFSAVRRNPSLILFSAAATLSLGPVWAQIYLPSVILILAGMLRALLNLFRPDWTRLRDVARISVDSASLGILLVLLKTGDWIVLKDAVNSSTADRQVVAILNQCFYYSLLVAGAVMAVMIVVNLWRFIRHELRRRPAGAEVSAHHS
jgi:TRAP-type C4-dicarboxylate transport system permease small subunit